MKILINLIGEQPIPNLLPVLYLKPGKTIVLFTDKTENVAKRLCRLVKNCIRIMVEPYSIESVFERLENEISVGRDLIFNITGGTKLMSIGLFQLAIQKKGEIVYLQSEKNKSILHRLKTDSADRLITEMEELPELIDINTYLKAHLSGFYRSKENPEYYKGVQYENAVVRTLQKNNFEVMQGVKPTGEGDQIEIDAVIRLKGTNNVGIAEIKIGDSRMESPKKGIDQLSTAGSREYLGTYTKKFLITRRKLNFRILQLAKAHGIVVIDKISGDRYNNISSFQKEKLIKTLTKHLT